MLEQLHVSHQNHIFFFDIEHLISDDLSVSLGRFLQIEIENLDLELHIIDGFLALEFVLFDPFLKFRNVLWMNKCL